MNGDSGGHGGGPIAWRWSTTMEVIRRHRRRIVPHAVLLALTLAAGASPGLADDGARSERDDTEGRYRLEIRVPQAEIADGAVLQMEFCLSPSGVEPIRACLGPGQGHEYWGARFGTTALVLAPEPEHPCTCKQLVTLEPNAPVCWPAPDRVKALDTTDVSLRGFVTVVEGVGELGATTPTCVRVKSSAVRLSIGPEAPAEALAGQDPN